MHVVLLAANAVLLNSMTSLLSARGHDVTCFDDPRRALDYIGANDHADALMVTSQFDSMPAAEICWEGRLLASYERPLYICLLSRPLGSIGLTEVLDCGADDVLQMPMHADELYARLRAAERLAQMHRELVNMATRDGLTGLLNRSAFFKRGGQLCLCSSTAVAAVMADIDHFKRVRCHSIRKNFATVLIGVRKCFDSGISSEFLLDRLCSVWMGCRLRACVTVV